MDFESVTKDLRANLAMLRQIARPEDAFPPDHGARIAKLRADSAKFQSRIDQNLAEMSVKLNRLIGMRTPDKR